MRQAYVESKLAPPNEGEWFQPWADPREQQVPECRVCAEDARMAMQRLARTHDYTTIDISMNHSHSCLWYDFHEARILAAYPEAVLVWTCHKEMLKLRRAHEKLMRADKLKCWWLKDRLVLSETAQQALLMASGGVR